MVSQCCLSSRLVDSCITHWFSATCISSEVVGCVLWILPCARDLHGLGSILIVWTNIWFSRYAFVLTDSYFWLNCCRFATWKTLTYADNPLFIFLYQCHTEEDWAACSGSHRGIVLRKTGWLVLEAFGGYLAEVGWVAYLISFHP